MAYFLVHPSMLGASARREASNLRSARPRDEERVAVEASDVAHAFTADSGKRLAAGLLGEDGERGGVAGHLQEPDCFDGERQRPARPYLPKCLEREVPRSSFGRG
jgi:hypothetical protein